MLVFQVPYLRGKFILADQQHFSLKFLYSLPPLSSLPFRERNMLLPKFQPEGEEEIKRTAGSLEIVEHLRRA
jgi:hypothetical protein